MGLFSSGKKNPEDDAKGTPPPQSSAPKAPPPPLVPPSAQQPRARLPQAPAGPPSGPASGRSSGGGLTPPGGMLPTPEWHAEFAGDKQPPGSRESNPGSSSRVSGLDIVHPPQPLLSGVRPPPPPSNPASATAPTVQMASGTAPTVVGGAANIPLPPAPPQARPSSSELPQQPVGTARLGLLKLLREAVERGASDLHLSRGVPPTIRLDGYLVPLDYPPLTRETCERLVTSILSGPQREKFETNWELDLSLDLPEAGRFRVNIHRQRGGIEAAFRVVNDVILPLRRLGLPSVVEEIARKHAGLVLVTGPTGSGKTTTMAAIIDQINNERQCMIVTIEDPIEYVHTNKRSIIKQREITSDTHSFADALRHVLRQDPDVIVVGEMRDLETISTALTAAETGHLVFATLHTPDASQTVDRMIDVFPPHQQEQARIQVANTLQAIIAQQLLPVPGNRGRVVAVEILIATVGARKIIRTGKTEQLFTTMQTNWESGMVTMDKSLKTLYQQGLISFDDAIARCKYPQEFDNI